MKRSEWLSGTGKEWATRAELGEFIDGRRGFSRLAKVTSQPPAVGLLKTLGARRMGWEEFPGSDPEIGMRTTAQRSGTLRFHSCYHPKGLQKSNTTFLRKWSQCET